MTGDFLPLNNQLPLREGTLDDLAALVRHRRLMFVDMGRAEGKEPDEAGLALMETAYAEHLRLHMPADALHAWVVDSPDGIVASGIVSIMPWPPKPGDITGQAGYLCSMYTEPAYRRRGLAQRIVLAAIDLCRRRELGCLLLSASDAGRGIYESIGFRQWDTFMRLHIE
jgi:GNAT superfamily N-acetyltransferase